MIGGGAIRCKGCRALLGGPRASGDMPFGGSVMCEYYGCGQISVFPGRWTLTRPVLAFGEEVYGRKFG